MSVGVGETVGRGVGHPQAHQRHGGGSTIGDGKGETLGQGVEVGHPHAHQRQGGGSTMSVGTGEGVGIGGVNWGKH